MQTKNKELEKAKEQERKELEATANFMRVMGVGVEAQAEDADNADATETDADNADATETDADNADATETDADNADATETDADGADVDVLAMIREVVETDVQAAKDETPKSKALLEAEANERKELEATKRFLKKAGLSVEQPQPKQPTPLQSQQDSKTMIGMFQAANGADVNPDVYYHQQEGQVSDLMC